MHVLDAAALDGALGYPRLVDKLDEAFRGGIVTPIRHHHHVERPDADATLLLMPAWTEKDRPRAFLGTKIVTVFPGNAERGLPSISGLYLLMDGATGSPLAAMDGARLTVWRTAAASALAARGMARAGARRMLMVGAGALAPFLIRAHASVRPIDRVDIWNRTPAAAEALAARMRAEGFEAAPCADLEAGVRAADLISSATLSGQALIRGDWLSAGAHLDLVGAYNMQTREADDEALRRARIVVDTAAALSEGGDVAIAIRSGALSESAVLGDLAALVRGEIVPRRGDGDITLFKSVGTAIEDLAAAILAYETILAGGNDGRAAEARQA